MDSEFYLVSVRDKETGKRVELLRFRIGTWQEIGWWLNESELIDTRYRVTISFVSENEFRQVPIHGESKEA